MSDQEDEIKVLEAAFIEGFRHASDKLGFLRLGHIPLELPHGGKLVEVALEENFEVGIVSPGFAQRSLVYHPLPTRLVQNRVTLHFIYQSPEGRRAQTLAEIYVLAREQAGSDHDHEHRHPTPALSGRGDRPRQ
jgi:hypothetical protein